MSETRRLFYPLPLDKSHGSSSLALAIFCKGVGSVAAVSSIGSAIELLSTDDWKEKYLMIEVMTCRGELF